MDCTTERLAAERNWFALCTASNNEKKVQQHLQMREMETFLPIYTVTKRWKNRTNARVDLPLFTGYVFVRLARAEIGRALEIPMVYSVVGSGRKATPLPDDEIESLKRGLQSRRVDPHPYVKIGSRVRIRSGVLAGLAGIVVRTDGNVRVVLNIDLIMQSVAVHVEADELEACE